MANFTFEQRASGVSFVEAIWRTEGVYTDSFISRAENRWEMVITKQYGKSTVTVRGPETKAKIAPVPQEAEFFGIIFKLGTFMPDMPVNQIVDEEIDLPDATNRSVWLLGDVWEIPNFENADTFLRRLVRQDLLVYDSLVEDVLQKQPQDLSLRTVQRRFLRATGMTQGTFQQIERAKYATSLLEQGFPILDTVFESGYADQPHLTRSLKRFMGQTPAEILQLSTSG